MNGGTNMLYTYSTEELIGLQDLIIERIESNEKEIHIYGKLERNRTNVRIAEQKQIVFTITVNK